MKRLAIISIGGLLVLVLMVGIIYFVYMRPDVSYRDVPQVRNTKEIEARLLAATASGRLTLRELGRVSYGDFSAPMWSVTRELVPPAKHRCFLLGSIHGNEPAGVECLIRFVERLAADESLCPDTAFEIIPLANPWGWAHNRRKNGDGYDLNRDFASFRGQESRLIGDFLKGKHYEVAIDLHEDSSALGFYLYQYAEANPAPAREVIATERDKGFAIEQNASMVILKTRDGLIRAPMWTIRCVQLVRKLSIGNYLRIENAPRVYTLETPSRQPFERRVDMDRTALERLVPHS